MGNFFKRLFRKGKRKSRRKYKDARNLVKNPTDIGAHADVMQNVPVGSVPVVGSAVSQVT